MERELVRLLTLQGTQTSKICNIIQLFSLLLQEPSLQMVTGSMCLVASHPGLDAERKVVNIFYLAPPACSQSPTLFLAAAQGDGIQFNATVAAPVALGRHSVFLSKAGGLLRYLNLLSRACPLTPGYAQKTVFAAGTSL